MFIHNCTQLLGEVVLKLYYMSFINICKNISLTITIVCPNTQLRFLVLSTFVLKYINIVIFLNFFLLICFQIWNRTYIYLYNREIMSNFIAQAQFISKAEIFFKKVKKRPLLTLHTNMPICVDFFLFHSM